MNFIPLIMLMNIRNKKDIYIYLCNIEKTEQKQGDYG